MNKRKAMELAQELNYLVSKGKKVNFKESSRFDGIRNIKVVDILVDGKVFGIFIKEKFAFIEYALKMKGGIQIG